MSSSFVSMVGRPTYQWEEVMLTALSDGTLQEAAGARSTLTLIAADGSKVIFEGTFNVISATQVTGTLTGFEVWRGTTQLVTADFSGSGAEIEDVPGVGQSNPTLTDLLEALQVMFGNVAMLATGSADGELLVGGFGSDTLTGNDGDEWLAGFAGDDTLDGGNGWDDVRYQLEAGTQNVIVNLSGSDKVVGSETIASGTARDTYGDTDTLVGINFVSGTALGDYFYGRDDRPDEFPDFVMGAAGSDRFTGGSGPLGVAYDQADIENGGAAVIVNLGGTKKYGVAGGHALDTFGDTDTLVNIFNVALSQRDDKAVGSSGDDHFWGRDGKDLMLGNKGEDRLEGDAGKDTLDGGKGKDSLSGGEGRDTLTGGADKDRFEFSDSAESKASASKRDFITDFKPGTDKIDLALVDANDIKANNQTFKYDGEDSSAAKGHLAWYQVDKAGTADDRTIIVMNTDNDAKFEMSIELKGLVDLTKGDFIL